jgi:hypothetical protein
VNPSNQSDSQRFPGETEPLRQSRKRSDREKRDRVAGGVAGVFKFMRRYSAAESKRIRVNQSNPKLFPGEPATRRCSDCAKGPDQRAAAVVDSEATGGRALSVEG